MFSLSTFQSNGQSQKLFHLRNIQRDVTRCHEMSPSIRILIDEVKYVVLAKIEVEDQDNSTQIEILPRLVNQDTQSEVKDQVQSFWE